MRKYKKMEFTWMYGPTRCRYCGREIFLAKRDRGSKAFPVTAGEGFYFGHRCSGSR